MGAKDIAEKNLIDQNDVFAAVCRAFLPDLKDIHPEDLAHLPVYLPISDVENKTVNALEKDVAKRVVKDGKCLAIIGIENQTTTDSAMAERVLAYAGATAAAWRMNHPEIPVPPIYTLVLYFGTKKSWQRVSSLYERWEIKEGNHPGLFPDVQPYIIDAGTLSKEIIDSIESEDLKSVFNLVQSLRSQIPVEKINSKGLHHPDAVFMTLLALGNFKLSDEQIKEYLEQIRQTQEEGEINMERVIHFASEAELKEKDALIRTAEEKTRIAEEKTRIAEEKSRRMEEEKSRRMEEENRRLRQKLKMLGEI